MEIAKKKMSRPVLMTKNNAFVRPPVGYGDVIYDETYNKTFHRKLKSI